MKGHFKINNMTGWIQTSMNILFKRACEIYEFNVTARDNPKLINGFQNSANSKVIITINEIQSYDEVFKKNFEHFIKNDL